MSISAAAIAYPCCLCLPPPFQKGKTNLLSTTLLPKSEKKKKKKKKKEHTNNRGSLSYLSLRCRVQLLPADLAPASSAVYGTLLLGGGLFAYARSGSKGSILGGLSGAVLLATAYYLMQMPETKEIGDALGFGTAFLFSAVFGIRLAATRKLVPAGPLLGLSIGALAVFASAYVQDKI